MRDRAAVITGLRPESHGGATLDHETRGRCPDPRRAVARGKPPRCRNARSAAPRFREYVVAREKAELNAHAGKPDRPTACLCTGRKVMIAAQLGPRHTAPVVAHDERVGSRFERDHRRPGVQGIRDDLADDRFLKRGGIGVPQVLEQVKQIDACFAHFRPASYVTSWRFVRHWSRKGRATVRACASVASTTSRSAFIARIWRFCVTLSFCVAGTSEIRFTPVSRKSQPFLGPML